MLWLPILERLPADVVVQRAPRAVLALGEDLVEGFARLGFGPEADGELAPCDLSGRRPLRELIVRGQRYVVRQFSHGGLLRWLTGSRFADPERPFRELLLSRTLTAAGLPTPRVAAARARRATGGGWYLDLVTERIEDTLDLGLLLDALRRGEVSRRDLAPILHSAGRLVRQLHDLDLVHADLNARNLVVRAAALGGAAPEMWVLDLDRSFIDVPLGDERRRRNLRRLFRFVARQRENGPAGLTRADFVRFLRGYDPTGERWKRDWRAIAAAHDRTHGFHAAGWVLERLARAGK